MAVRWGITVVAVVAATFGLVSCGVEGTPAPTASNLTEDEHFAAFEACADLPSPWLCATIDVPLDRHDRAAGSIPLRILGIPHRESNAEEPPLFVLPGGPGDAGINNYALWQLPAMIRANHDVVAIDPRGTGESAAIDCPDLQDGSASLEELLAASDACGRQLGAASDLFSSSETALDLDAVREFMGYDRIVLHGTSYGGVDVQAYASRFPDRLAAVVIDGGFMVDDLDMFFGTDVAAGAMQVVDTACRADAECAASTDDPTGVVSAVVRQLGTAPVVENGVVAVDEASIARLIREAAVPVEVVAASLDFLNGDTAALAKLVDEHDALVIPPDGDVESFSTGANAAAWCDDQAAPFDAHATPAQRRSQLANALTALDDDAFAPWSKEGWRAFWLFDACVGWPAPSRADPVVPDEASFRGVPALLLVGDQDPAIASAPALKARFPHGTVVIVPGARHPSLSFGPCVAAFEAQFIESGEVPAQLPCAES